jgi:hypothetical protein
LKRVIGGLLDEEAFPMKWSWCSAWLLLMMLPPSGQFFHPLCVHLTAQCFNHIHALFHALRILSIRIFDKTNKVAEEANPSFSIIWRFSHAIAKIAWSIRKNRPYVKFDFSRQKFVRIWGEISGARFSFLSRIFIVNKKSIVCQERGFKQKVFNSISVPNLWTQVNKLSDF